MVRLRDPETGCPWDRVQTLSTLKPCVLEETYELLAAMDRPDDQSNYVEELGDVDATDPATVLRNWEQIKQQEHRKEARHSALDGVPSTLPALLKAQRSQEKAARVGFDWKDAKGPLAKIREEIAELEEAVATSSDTSLDEHVKEELGDLLFSVTNLARHLKADSESALEGSTAKFARRFRAVEAGAKAAGRDLKSMTLEEMDARWDKAKDAEG